MRVRFFHSPKRYRKTRPGEKRKERKVLKKKVSHGRRGCVISTPLSKIYRR